MEFLAVLRVRKGKIEALELKEEPRTWTGIQPRKLRSDPSAWADLPSGASQLVVAAHDGAGKVVGTAAFNGFPTLYSDHRRGAASAKGNPLRGGRRYPDTYTLQVRVTLTEKPAFLSVQRLDVVDRSEATGPEGVDLGNDRLLVRGVKGMTAVAVPETALADAPKMASPLPDLFSDLLQPDDSTYFIPQELGTLLITVVGGEIVSGSVMQPHDPTVTNKPFDIVITGDGFASDEELCILDQIVFGLTMELLSNVAFEEVQKRIRVSYLKVRSAQSGISSCPNQEKDTTSYYGVRGYFGGEDSPTFCGMEVPSILDDAIAGTFGEMEPSLKLMIVNCSESGGSASHDTRTAFVTLGFEIPPPETNETSPTDSDTFWTSPTWRELASLALHESAHVIANLADEYIDEIEWDGETHHPNMVQRYAPSKVVKPLPADTSVLPDPPWIGLAREHELDRSGRLGLLGQWPLKYVHDDIRVTAFSTQSDDVRVPEISDSTGAPSLFDPAKNLGLFWGCSYIQKWPPGRISPDDLGIRGDIGQFGDDWIDPRGWNFFRPMAQCKMRMLSWEFCRVCAHSIKEQVIARTT